MNIHTIILVLVHTNINKCTHKKTCITYKQTYIQTYMSIQTNIHIFKQTNIYTNIPVHPNNHTYIY